MGLAERDWLSVEDHCAAISLIVEKGESGETYSVGANAELANIDLARAILEVMGKDESYIDHVEDRLGHDVRYAVDSRKVRDLGWAPVHMFEEHLESTVAWYVGHRAHRELRSCDVVRRCSSDRRDSGIRR